MLANLLANFYEFLESSPRPADDDVREMFTSCNNKWNKYCEVNQLMNWSQLFIVNVQEAWKRHSTDSTKENR